jgi:predicted RNase H-like HicB family nuclease
MELHNCTKCSCAALAVSYLANAAMKLKIVVDASDDGGFTAYAPTLPGCISEGDTRDEALSNIREAIDLYLESDDGDLAGRDGLEVIELVV